ARYGLHLSRAERKNDPGAARDRQERRAARRCPGILADEQGPSAAGALQGARDSRARAPRGGRDRQTGDQGEDARAEAEARRRARSQGSRDAEERAPSASLTQPRNPPAHPGNGVGAGALRINVVSGFTAFFRSV